MACNDRVSQWSRRGFLGSILGLAFIPRITQTPPQSSPVHDDVYYYKYYYKYTMITAEGETLPYTLMGRRIVYRSKADDSVLKVVCSLPR